MTQDNSIVAFANNANGTLYPTIQIFSPGTSIVNQWIVYSGDKTLWRGNMNMAVSDLNGPMAITLLSESYKIFYYNVDGKLAEFLWDGKEATNRVVKWL